MDQKLVILRGAPASGKTTISKHVRNIEKNIVWLSVDGIKPIFSEYKNETLEQTNSACLVMLEHLLGQGYSVIYDGIFKNPSHLYQATEIAKKKYVHYVIYQLDCSLQILQEREKNRDGVRQGLQQPLGDELVAGLYKKILDNQIDDARMLDTENQTVEKCVEIIKKNFT